MTHRYTIWPLRFSPNPAAMIEFFTVLGLHNTLSHPERTFATFDGRSGKLGIHTAAGTASGAVPGHTSLNFTTADITAAGHELVASGLEVHIWDETYGKQGVIIAPQGAVIGLNEDTEDDLYGGYQVHERTAATPLDVVAICHTDDIAREVAYFASFGFTADSVNDSPLEPLHADGNSGILALRHRHSPLRQPSRRPPETSSARPYPCSSHSRPTNRSMRSQNGSGNPGDQAATGEDQAGRHVSVTDPDGEEIQIGPSA